MSFEKWLEDFDKEYANYVLKNVRNQTKEGLTELRDSKGSVLMRNSYDNKSLQLYIAYRNQTTTNMLVWATWALAIGTLILSGLTIYFQYFKN